MLSVHFPFLPISLSFSPLLSLSISLTSLTPSLSTHHLPFRSALSPSFLHPSLCSPPSRSLSPCTVSRTWLAWVITDGVLCLSVCLAGCNGLSEDSGWDMSLSSLVPLPFLYLYLPLSLPLPPTPLFPSTPPLSLCVIGCVKMQDEYMSGHEPHGERQRVVSQEQLPYPHHRQ